MKLLDQLKATLAATTPNRWGFVDGVISAYQSGSDEAIKTTIGNADEQSIVLLHNHAPDLIEAVEVLDALDKWLGNGVVEGSEIGRMKDVLDKFK